ncbi:hypothetical protein I545_0354 [Mycobacterium kansasii 662]|uniref:Uncharacterized protein n=2 Tax=Mycobacterium kansasii TaxID=1768 RepID=A0A1V3XYT2_MYCKA|nr:hypothetical protein I547_1044 [Mycobacterium kansasii 824]EUA22330.1 hypothetical protein I545_0354 [Mycobacterium kansasii 662]OOK83661.1 hypothetical protein BZL29_0376 [Mycobacterium kansasii]
MLGGGLGSMVGNARHGSRWYRQPPPPPSGSHRLSHIQRSRRRAVRIGSACLRAAGWAYLPRFQ